MLIFFAQIILVLSLLSSPVSAGEPLSVDEMISTYDPNDTYKIQSQYQEKQIKRRIPIDNELEQDTSEKLPPIHDAESDQTVQALISMVIESVIAGTLAKKITLKSLGVIGLTLIVAGSIPAIQRRRPIYHAKKGLKSLADFSRNRLFPFAAGIGSIATGIGSTVRTRVKQAQKTVSQGYRSLKNRILSVNQPPPVPESTETEGTIDKEVSLPPFHNRSIDPFDTSIPQEVQEVYQWSTDWDPKLTSNWLQCTTFVAMTYNLNGHNLKGKLVGDARDWIYLTDTFHVHESGASMTMPQPLDTLVWAENGANHVGIVTQVQGSTITVANANASSATYTFTIHKGRDGSLEIKNKQGKTSKDAWVPSHWLRLK
ncbi:MAG: CHAP domain-containing protein [Patescibacteria group bacterium]